MAGWHYLRTCGQGYGSQDQRQTIGIARLSSFAPECREEIEKSRYLTLLEVDSPNIRSVQ
jgi:hypothetical protein